MLNKSSMLLDEWPFASRFSAAGTIGSVIHSRSWARTKRSKVDLWSSTPVDSPVRAADRRSRFPPGQCDRDSTAFATNCVNKEDHDE